MAIKVAVGEGNHWVGVGSRGVELGVGLEVGVGEGRGVGDGARVGVGVEVNAVGGGGTRDKATNPRQ